MEKNYLLTILVAYLSKEPEALSKTCGSIAEGIGDYKEQVCVKIISSANASGAEEVGQKYRAKCNIEVVYSKEETAISMFQEYKELPDSQFVQFLEEGDQFIQSSLKILLDKLAQNPRVECFGLMLNSERQPERKIRVPLDLSSRAFRCDLAAQQDFNLNTPYDAGIVYAWKFYAEYEASSLELEDAFMRIPSFRLQDDFMCYQPAQDKRWYTETLRETYLALAGEYGEKGEEVPLLLQYLLFYELKCRFMHNQDLKDKHVFHEKEEWEEFLSCCKALLSYMEDPSLLNIQAKDRIFVMNDVLVDQFMRLKYEKLEPQVLLRGVKGGIDCDFGYRNVIYTSFSKNPANIEAIDYENEKLIISFSHLLPVIGAEYEMTARLLIKEKRVPVNVKTILLDAYEDNKYFEKNQFRRKKYQISIEEKYLSHVGLKIQFLAVMEGHEIPLRIIFRRFPARLTRKLTNSYWAFGKYLLRFQGGYYLTVGPGDPLHRVLAEARVLKELFVKNRKVFRFRCGYWICRPFAGKKRAWITFDKMYKGGDNGEYFYKYAEKQKDGVTPYYLVNRGYPDTERLEKEGSRLLYYGTFRHKFRFLTSEIIAATHANIPVFSGFDPADFEYVRDLFRPQVVCIQHGLTVQMLPHNQNRLYDNLKRYYLASPAEMENLLRPIYGYSAHPEILRTTGLARYDGLKSQDKRQLLLMPTWRQYIAMPASTGNVRPYSETFKETIYFKIFHSLIHNEKLLEACRRYHYRFVFVLHPVIASQLEDFSGDGEVEVLSPIGLNYETMLTESSLMITDYSGVQFDFAYMRKPLVYYHPTELPAHYEDGGFDYVTQGFGEICEEEETLVETLCDYLSKNCEVKSFYLERQNSFFYHSDDKSCERIYRDLLEFTGK